MKTLFRGVLKGEYGTGMVMVLSFMALCVPMLTAGLALAGALSHDSQVKTKLAKDQYSSIGALEYIRYLADDPQRWDDFIDENPNGKEFPLDDDTVKIEADVDGYADYGFLDYCIFGSSSVHVKENSTVNCGVGSNGNIDVKENSVITGDITSGGDVMLKENVEVNGDVTAAGQVTLKANAVVNGLITEGATVDYIAGPTPNFDVTITTTRENNDVTTQHTSVEGSQLGLTFNLQAGGADITVNSGQTYNLPPDSYGTVEVKENATLNLASTLASGAYAFEEITIKENATINIDVTNGPVVFDAVTVLEFKENITMNVTGGTAADFVVRVENQANFKENGKILGTYFGFEAAYAEMHAKENSTLTGALYGDVVEVKENTVVHGMPAQGVYLSFFGN